MTGNIAPENLAPAPQKTREVATPMARKAAFSATIGTALEWFDFVIYGTLSATVFPALFFPGLTPVMALLASFAAFGVGFFARPLGGVVFGYLGDKHGRKVVLTYTLIVMGAASAAMGMLPSFAAIGLAAPILLVFLRLLQGFAAGGETTGAQLMSIEHAPRTRRGAFGSFVAIGSPISQVMATLVLTGLAAGLSKEDFNNWGWRIPLVASLLLIFVGVWIRRSLEETPAFAAEQEEKTTKPRAFAVFKSQPGTIIRLILTWGAPSSLFYIATVFTLSYMTGTLGFPNSISFGILVIANLASIAAALLGGRIADKIGMRNSYLVGLLTLTFFTGMLFVVLGTKNVVLIVTCMAGCLGSVQFMAAAQPAFFAESFPTAMRYTGSASSYTGGSLIFASTAPFIATAILAATGGNLIFVALYALGLSAMSITAVLASPKKGKHNW
jgi:MFS family permease